MRPIFLLTILCVTSNAAFANPVYDGKTLHISSVDVDKQAGFYQQIQLQSLEDNLWRLVSAEQGHLLRSIENVEIIKTESLPVQVFLKVQGTHSSPCDKVGEISSRYHSSSNTLEVNMYYEISKDEGFCSGVFVPFEVIEPLPAYGAPAGAYKVLLNGEYELEFELSEDNVLSFGT